MANSTSSAARAKRSDEDTGGTNPPPMTGLEAKDKQVAAAGTLPLSAGNGIVRVSVVVEVTSESQGQEASKRSDEDTGGTNPPPKTGLGVQPLTASGALSLPPMDGGLRVSVVVEVAPGSAIQQARAKRSDDPGSSGDAPGSKTGLRARKKR